MDTVKVCGTAWNALLNLALNALSEMNSPLAEAVLSHLDDHLALPETYGDFEAPVEVVELVRNIAPAIPLTEAELSYVQAECVIILLGGTT